MLYFDTQCGNSDIENANFFNEFPYSIFTWNDSDNPISNMPSPLTEVEFSNCNFYNILANLDASKVVGIDGMGSRVLNKCALPLCYPLHLQSA